MTAALAASARPHLIGVRHHSPTLAAAMPALLAAARPDVLLLELPADVQDWVSWLAHPEARAPLALAVTATGGPEETPGFYPFADFSPELAAVRFCATHGIPVRAIDLPAGARPLPEPADAQTPADAPAPADEADAPEADETDRALVSVLCARLGVDDPGALWDALVEARAPGSSPEALRRAALLAGWLLRLDAPALTPRDARREAHMRRSVAAAAAEGFARPVAVVGAFHAAALAEDADPGLDPFHTERSTTAEPPPGPVTASLLPYAFELFDDRSGYPAGIRDPRWRQRLYEVLAPPATDGAAGAEALVDEVLVDVARHVRRARHVAGLPDAREAARAARDLARLRGLPAPGRTELLEALMLALGQGEPLGRGRVLARALESVMVGRTRGRLAPETPRAGLLPHVEALLAALRLPGPESAGRESEPLRLDPLRSPIDRRRHVALMRLTACHVPYAERRESGYETLTHVWEAVWTPQTEALLAVAGLRGATLAQATAGGLRGEWQRRLEADEAAPPALVETLAAAAECGLAGLTRDLLGELGRGFTQAADLQTLTAAVHLVDRIAAGHVPGLPPPGEGADEEPGAVPAFDPAGLVPPLPDLRLDLLEAAVRHLDGLSGSNRVEDALALRGLLALSGDAETPAGGRLRYALSRLATEGSPLMRGAAGAARVLLHVEAADAFGTSLASVVDVAEADFRSAFWRGAFTVAGALLEADPDLLAALGDRIEGDADAAFLALLPSLRDGFEALSPAARARLLAALNDRLGAGAVSERLIADPAALAATARADAAGRAAAHALFGPLPEVPRTTEGTPARRARASSPADAGHTLSPADRWRLVLGQVKGGSCSAGARRLASTLEQLYGRGAGEGSGGDLVGAGDEASTPTVREWADELSDLFGERVREEVLGRAALNGQAEAALALDPESVTPSVELLEEVLSLKGGLSEAQLTHLRRLVDRVVQDLVRALARRLQPALTGLGTPRPSRRKAGPLDLNRTVRANLRGARPGEDPPLVPERFIFRTRARRSLDWRVVLVVDVSGSMEASVIYSALVAAILSALPAFKVDFLAFSTEVVDLTDRVDDPLGLLMEVSVGGGTNIARALKAARERVTVPSRTLVLVVSDFEEGGGVGELLAQVRALVESGVRTLGLAALDDRGAPRYAVNIAEQLVSAGMPVAALSPLALAEWLGAQVRG